MAGSLAGNKPGLGKNILQYIFKGGSSQIIIITIIYNLLAKLIVINILL